MQMIRLQQGACILNCYAWRKDYKSLLIKTAQSAFKTRFLFFRFEHMMVALLITVITLITAYSPSILILAEVRVGIILSLVQNLSKVS